MTPLTREDIIKLTNVLSADVEPETWYSARYTLLRRYEEQRLRIEALEDELALLKKT